jgi:hypothetical protein
MIFWGFDYGITAMMASKEQRNIADVWSILGWHAQCCLLSIFAIQASKPDLIQVLFG